MIVNLQLTDLERLGKEQSSRGNKDFPGKGK